VELKTIQQLRDALRNDGPVDAHDDILPLPARLWNRSNSAVDAQIHALRLSGPKARPHRRVILHVIGVGLSVAFRFSVHCR